MNDKCSANADNDERSGVTAVEERSVIRVMVQPPDFLLTPMRPHLHRTKLEIEITLSA